MILGIVSRASENREAGESSKRDVNRTLSVGARVVQDASVRDQDTPS